MFGSKNYPRGGGGGEDQTWVDCFMNEASMAAVQGRLPHGWHIAARFDRETGIVEITSPDTDRFSIDVDISKLEDEYGYTHKPASGKLEDACLEAKYDPESGILRYDTAQVPEFWLELRSHQIMRFKKQKAVPTASVIWQALRTRTGWTHVEEADPHVTSLQHLQPGQEFMIFRSADKKMVISRTSGDTCMLKEYDKAPDLWGDDNFHVRRISTVKPVRPNPIGRL